MTPEETKKQLDDTMAILNGFFFPKAQNSDVIVENSGDKFWYYMHEHTAKKLKHQILKYQTR